MKIIFYGNTGFGKSYNLISPIIKDAKKIVYITKNGVVGECNYMGLDKDIFEIVPIGGTIVSNKCAVDLFEIPCVEIEKVLQKVFEMLADVVRDSEYTIIFSGFQLFVNEVEYIRLVTKWEANVVIEYTCSKNDIERGELEYIRKSDRWTCVPVFAPLYSLPQEMNEKLTIACESIENITTITEE